MRKAFLLVFFSMTVFFLAGCNGNKNIQVKSSGFCCHAIFNSENISFEGLMCVDDDSVTFEIESPAIIKGIKITAGADSLSVSYGDVNKTIDSGFVRDMSFLTDVYRCFASLPENSELNFKDGLGLYSGNAGDMVFNINFTTSGYPVSLSISDRDMKITLSDHGPAE